MELTSQALLICSFEQTRPEGPMNFNGTGDDLAGKWIFLCVSLCAHCVLCGEISSPHTLNFYAAAGYKEGIGFIFTTESTEFTEDFRA